MPALDRAGEYGCVVTSETDATTGDFYAIFMLADTVFSAMTAPRVTHATAIGDITHPKGEMWYVGDCTSFTLASGTVCAYRNGT